MINYKTQKCAYNYLAKKHCNMPLICIKTFDVCQKNAIKSVCFAVQSIAETPKVLILQP